MLEEIKAALEPASKKEKLKAAVIRKKRCSEKGRGSAAEKQQRRGSRQVFAAVGDPTSFFLQPGIARGKTRAAGKEGQTGMPAIGRKKADLKKDPPGRPSLTVEHPKLVGRRSGLGK